AVLALTFTGLVGAAAPTAAPEDVGLSAERLQRVDELVARHLEAGSFTGAVTLVARNGHIAHLAAHGFMDVQRQLPMREDSIFRIMSLTKPVIGVATLMMIEERRVRLQDPVSRYIPEWQDMMVGVAIPEPQGRGGGAGQRGAGAGPRAGGAGPGG